MSTHRSKQDRPVAGSESIESRGSGTETTESKLRSWIRSGACQGTEGAFHAWRDASTDQLSFAYPEISGYALTYFASQRDLTRAEVRAGARAADWLIARLDANNLAARDGWDSGAEYNFDLAMMATGLMTFGKRITNDQYVEHGLQLSGFLQEQITSPSGIHALTPKTRSVSRHSGWATEGQAHLAKVVQCLLIASTIGLSGAEDSAAALVEQAISCQSPIGGFQTQADSTFTMLHPHHYAIEGLWMWGACQRHSAALDRARRGVEWAWQFQLDSGGFPRMVDHSNDHRHTDQIVEQSDVTAQAVRMALALGVQHPGIDRAVQRLSQVAMENKQGQSVLYQPTSETLHLNTWASLFAAQALRMVNANDAAVAPVDLV